MSISYRYYFFTVMAFVILAYTPLSNSIALLSRYEPYAKNVRAIEAVLVSAHNYAFGKSNLVLEKMQPKEVVAWNQMLHGSGKNLGVKGFTQQYGKPLMRYFITISYASISLINTLKAMYNTYVIPVLRNPDDTVNGIRFVDPKRIDLQRIDLEGMRAHLKKMNISYVMIKTMQKELKDRWLFFPRLRKTREILLKLAFTIEVTMDKARIDFKKIVDASEQYRFNHQGVRHRVG